MQASASFQFNEWIIGSGKKAQKSIKGYPAACVMPPPPPPSASYLLDINTDSNDNGDAMEEEAPPEAAVSQQQQAQQDNDNDNNTNRTKKKKRKKRKKRKKKKKKGVHFGNVSVREYERCLGSDVVPLDGGWPLGISTCIRNEYQVAPTVDEFEERRQEELRDRWFNIMSNHTDPWNGDDNLVPPPPPPKPLVPPTGDLETRQYDYRKRPHDITKSTKNPLFGPLDEETRMMLLVNNDSSTTNNDDDSSIHSENSHHTIPRSPSRSPSHTKQQQQQQQRRARSNSMHNNDSHYNNNNNRRSSRRTRSNSEQYYSTQYPSTDVLHVRNELEQIRVSRTLEGSVGCTCRKLNVYLPPLNGGGKKAQHRRLKPSKVKEELRKRGKLPSNANDLTRAQLEQLLHDIVEQEPCCWAEDCSCRKNGIGCQADACSCWFESHQCKGQQNHHGDKEDFPSVKSIRERCGNNMYAVDLDGIHDFRLQYCQVIDTSDSKEVAE